MAKQYDIDIRGFLTNSFVEWDGRICPVVFTARCNWRCSYCHGARFVLDPDSLDAIQPQAVFDLIEQQKDWLDGIAITGGEPTLQQGLVDFIRDLNAAGMPVKLETNGTHPEVLETLLQGKLLACLSLDYKAPLDERLSSVTCVSDAITDVAAVRKSYELARQYADQIEREFHTTLCPALLDVKMIEDMARDLNQPGALWVLQQYETDAEMLDAEKAGTRRFDVAELEEIEDVAKAHHDRVLLRKGKGA